jgi:protein-disulfide isomerase
MPIRPFNVAFAVLSVSVALAAACSAQPPAAAAADTQKQVDALRTQVNAMQKDLDEIKALLAPLRERQARSPMNNLFDLGDRPVRGFAGAKVTLVELTDYQ